MTASTSSGTSGLAPSNVHLLHSYCTAAHYHKIPMITTVVPKLPFINKQTTIDFYVSQLSCSLVSDYGDYFIVKADAAELHFFAFAELVPAQSSFMIYLRIDQAIEHFYERLIAQSVKILTPLEPKPWGQTEFAITDPNGTLLTFGQAGEQ